MQYILSARLFQRRGLGLGCPERQRHGERDHEFLTTASASSGLAPHGFGYREHHPALGVRAAIRERPHKRPPDRNIAAIIISARRARQFSIPQPMMTDYSFSRDIGDTGDTETAIQCRGRKRRRGKEIKPGSFRPLCLCASAVNPLSLSPASLLKRTIPARG